jgi:hypothetical protein
MKVKGLPGENFFRTFSRSSALTLTQNLHMAALDRGLERERFRAGMRVFRTDTRKEHLGPFVYISGAGTRMYTRPLPCDEYDEQDNYSDLYKDGVFFRGDEQDYLTAVERFEDLDAPGARNLLDMLRDAYSFANAAELADRRISHYHDAMRAAGCSSTARAAHENALGLWQREFQTARGLAHELARSKEQYRVGERFRVIDGAGSAFAYKSVESGSVLTKRPADDMESDDSHKRRRIDEQQRVGPDYEVEDDEGGGFLYTCVETGDMQTAVPPDAEQESDEESDEELPGFVAPPKSSMCNAGALPFALEGRALSREVELRRPLPTEAQVPDGTGYYPMRHDRTIMTLLGHEQCALEAIRFLTGDRRMTRGSLQLPAKGLLNVKALMQALTATKTPFQGRKQPPMTWDKLPLLPGGLYMARALVGTHVHCIGYDAWRKLLFIGGTARGEADPLAHYVYLDYEDPREATVQRGWYLEDEEIAHPERFADFIYKTIAGVRRQLDTVYRIDVKASRVAETGYM